MTGATMKIYYNLISLKLALITLVFLIGTVTLTENNYPTVETPPAFKIETMEDSVTYEIQKLNFQYPHIVLAQAKLESGNFTSKIFNQNNNMFGMKMPSRRPTTAVGKKSSYAYYNTWMCSIEDLKIYYDKYLRDKSEHDVYAFLSRNYAQDPNYVKKLKAIIQKENLKDKFYNEHIV